MKRHLGRVTNTGQNCVVVYMQIPGREDHALVVSVDSLPLTIESYLMQVLESPEGQNDPVLANVLTRKLMPDTGQPLLMVLHQRGLLSPVPIDNIVMLPSPNMPFPLRGIIEANGGVVPTSTQTAPAVPQQQAELNKFNPYGQTQQIETSDTNRAIAGNLMIEAQLLEDEAQRKRNEAYKYDPSLRPQVLATPVAVSETVVKTVKKPRAARAKKATS